MDDVPRFRPPPCKSSFTRALLLAWLSGGRTEIRWEPDSANPAAPLADDVRVVADAIAAFGARVEWADRAVVLAGSGYRPPAGTAVDLGLNGTALRTLTAIVGCLGGTVRLAGQPGLARRPLGDLVALLTARGAQLDFEGESGRVPFVLRAPDASGPITGRLDLRMTSQAATGVLLACAAGGHGGSLEHPGPLGYLDLTREWLHRFGAETRRDGARTSVAAGGLTSPGVVQVPGDPSAAAWIYALAAGLGRRVGVSGAVAPGHPDAGMLDLLGDHVEVETESGGDVLVSGTSSTRPLDVDLESAPDLFPPLVAYLTCVPARHRLRAAKLRHKESDRIAVLARALAALGLEVAEEVDGLAFEGAARGAIADRSVTLDPAGDHRMAMAFSCIAAIHGCAIEIRDRECVAKSWPGFWGFRSAFCE